VIKEAKDVLEAAVRSVSPGIAVARSMAEEKHSIMSRVLPLVSLITNPGRFDNRTGKTVRWYDAEEETYKQRKVRGSRTLPLLLRCFAESEDAADALFSVIIPALPSRWEFDGFEGAVRIGTEEHSDFAGNVSQLYLSVAEVEFTVDVAGEEEIVPTITTVASEPGGINTDASSDGEAEEEETEEV
jgi:hypothetical protein